MGWARTLLLGDIGNRLDIADTERDIEDLRGEVSSKRERDQTQDEAIKQLEKENAQLELCLAALIKTLQGKSVLSGEEVTRLVDLIDDEPG